MNSIIYDLLLKSLAHNLQYLFWCQILHRGSDSNKFWYSVSSLSVSVSSYFHLHPFVTSCVTQSHTTSILLFSQALTTPDTQ